MKLFFSAVLGAALVISATAADASAQSKIRIGWNQAPGHMASMTWHDKSLGYLTNSDKSYIAEPIRFQGSGHQVTAIAAGQVDIAAMSPVAFVQTVKKAGLDTRIIADVLHTPCDGNSFAQPFYAQKSAGIKTWSDLKGKKIAINSRGSAHDMTVAAALAKGGIKDSEVTRVEMKFASMVPFLKEGKVDVGGFLPQFVPPVASDPKLMKVFDVCSAGGPVASVVLVARDGFIEKNRQALIDMLADQMRAVRWFYDPKNRDKMLNVIAAVTKAPKESFADYVFTAGDYARSKDLYIDPKVVQNTIDNAVEFGVLKEGGLKVDPDYIDYSIIKAAKKQVDG
jgi:ABC-type nitrate/sulfonate/bicarbonate transport system substrate-binding protein